MPFMYTWASATVHVTFVGIVADNGLPSKICNVTFISSTNSRETEELLLETTSENT